MDELKDIMPSKRNKPVTRGQMLCGSISVRYLVKLRDRKWKGGYQGLGGREVGSYCLIGTEFQFCKKKRFLRMDGG